MPALQGYGVGLVVLLAFGAPPVLALRRVPALRVLRRDLDRDRTQRLAGRRSPASSGSAALLWWKAGSATLGSAMLLGIVATLAVLALLAWLLILLVRRAALAPARQPALRPGQRQPPRRHQRRAGVRARAWA